MLTSGVIVGINAMNIILISMVILTSLVISLSKIYKHFLDKSCMLDFKMLLR